MIAAVMLLSLSAANQNFRGKQKLDDLKISLVSFH